MDTQKYKNILFLGIGTVGGAVLRLLGQKILATQDNTWRIAGIMSRNVREVLEKQAPEILPLLRPEQIFGTWDALREYLDRQGDLVVDVVVELLGGLEPCLEIHQYFLQRRVSIITANKALLAAHGAELFPLAQKNHVSIACEASCGGGIPILGSLLYGLSANYIHEFHGVLNGTCNFILTKMTEENLSYSEALSQAQTGGLAEADPFLDISGSDTAHKLVILAMMSFGASLSLQNIPICGVDSITKEQIQVGEHLGLATKLLASAYRLSPGCGNRGSEPLSKRIALRVGPCFVPRENHHQLPELSCSPLAFLTDSFNGISFYGDNVGHIYLEGRGAGASATASAVLADLNQILTSAYAPAFASFPNWPSPEKLQSKNFWPELRQNWLLFLYASLSSDLPEQFQHLYSLERGTVYLATEISEQELQALVFSVDQSLQYIPILSLPKERLQGELMSIL